MCDADGKEWKHYDRQLAGTLAQSRTASGHIIYPPFFNVHFHLESGSTISGHCAVKVGCPLSDNSGHRGWAPIMGLAQLYF